MGLHEWDKYTYGPGFYYWRGSGMAKNHVIVIQLSEYANPEIAPGRLHVIMLLPVGGSAYNYKYDGPIEKMPKGKFLGPIPSPEKMTY